MLSLEKLQEIVSAADFDKLIGEIENEWFDCKASPYQLQNDISKKELAKDVSSFSNFEGGFIFIGVKTSQSDEHFGDEVESLRPFNKSLVDPIQYRNVIGDWVYPDIEGVDVKWIEITSQAGRGLVVITVPEQKESTKPFLITKTLDGERKIETLFGYAQRKGDTNKPATIADMQRYIQSGFHYEKQIKNQLDGIEVLLRSVAQHNQAQVQSRTNGERIEQRITRALEHAYLGNERTITISAYPNQPSQLQTIFLTSEHSIRRHLETPPILRRGGWSIETLDQARIMRGEMIRVANGDRKVIDLYKDGTLVFIALADHRFLAWHDEERQKINSAALIEVIYSFVSFYKLVLDDLENLPEEITLRVDFKNLHLDDIKSYLLPYQLGSLAQGFEDQRRDAPDNDGAVEKTFLTDNFDIGAVAFELIREVYLWFGFEEEKIPYVQERDGLKTINADAIASL
ncbi:hypothetical protein A3D81_00760 [Candidatus Curtissbacteria bacterium RIFCSPHIGHO2_02_FULL_40_17]|uniref:Schlafen AlbA-2 domain-containing protein n=4 Tax=Patescibacteria group TaxID=1783273 RepID=A0A1G2HGD8_9BACT|nr:MAG: hypothetical protein A3D81_00760 [Candidatus Curtissbacteria bacterium RIFCSPHIGHO2_02_FULL_40_17]OGE03845.1 MAG: hypothetical protein A3F45_01075 [Candidatus Curtissbacteria bacterium RIFCSPHIGHO2_12_FULL_41_17]OGE05922.1 MAG: hypothetical protein A3I53_02250 [Candidatus Curtissbacteria bacterium RIFCSPLOWO2_02_FULL_40_13b]OGZ61554.1 MAG: hypothetical protein A3F94_00230 [Candidatus Spechtbacteria bacterium RIFCSPLOWO2_12_FULL_38_22]